MKKTVEQLSGELWRKIEESQGCFFVSDDGAPGMTEEQFFERIRGRLAWGRKAVRDMDTFLRKYKQTDAQVRRP